MKKTVCLDCDSIEQAKRMFPHLNKSMVVSIQTKDGELVLFSQLPFSNDDKKLFKQCTRKEIIEAFELSLVE